MTADTLLEYLDLHTGAAELTQLDEVERLILDDVNSRIAAQESTEAVVDFLFDRTRNICPGDRISVAFVDDTEQRLISHYTRATYQPLVLRKGYTEDLRGSSLEHVIRAGLVRVIHDLERYFAEHPRSRSSRGLVKEGVRSSLTCPLRVEGRVVGVLFRSARAPNAYSQRHALLHAAIADRLSQAIEKTYRLEQLAAANLAYTEMLGFVSHELKSPVASMVSTAQLFRDGYLGPVDDQQRDAIDRIVNKGNYLLGLVRDYLELARIEGGELRYEPRRDVKFEEEVLVVALEVVREETDRRQIQIERQLMLSDSVALDDSLFKIVMVNLLSNAVKYGRDGGRVRVTAQQTQGEFVVSVWNEGVGFPAEEQSRLFKRFSRLRTKELRAIKGSGVGLYTVWRIVQLHRGKITASSKYGEWAEFTLTVPQNQAPNGNSH